ncbi:MAG: hypothetical protein K2O95_00565 [Clostridia bacterium]|nr:hypothetical protein [Clostridia bacterium]
MSEGQDKDFATTADAKADGGNSESLNSETYKCPSCGNFLYYDPKSRKLKCDYCKGSQRLQPVEDAVELPYNEDVEQGFESWQGVKSVKCNACGAVTVLPAYDVVVNCPFCNASNIVEAEDIGGLRPNGILPFRVSKQDVPDIYVKWLKSKHIAPNKLKKQAERQACSGVYVPVFTFDSNCDCSYSIRYGKFYTTTVGSGKNRRTVTRTRWYCDSGRLTNFFNDVQVEASKSITQKNLQKLGGFDTDNSLEYHSQFLSGYSAERYDKGLDESWREAKTAMEEAMRSMIISRYNADVVDYVRMDNLFFDRTYKYVLVPIWVFNYIYSKKSYSCIVNGRSGKLIGNYPKSPVKIGSIALAVGAVVGVLMWLFFKYFA